MAHIKHTHEEKMAKAKRICDIYSEGENDLESICDSEGIAEQTFRNWTYEIGEIGELYKGARLKNNIAQKGKIRAYALSSLAKKVMGYDYEEVTTEAKNVKTTEKRKNEKGEEEEFVVWKPQITKKVTKTIKVQPDSTLIMFALNNSNVIEDANFNHSNKVVHTGGTNADGSDKPISVENSHTLPKWLKDLKGIKDDTTQEQSEL